MLSGLCLSTEGDVFSHGHEFLLCTEVPKQRWETQWAMLWAVYEVTSACTGLPQWLSGKECPCQCRGHRFHPWVRKIPWRRKWQSTPVFLPGKSHGQRSVGRLQSTGSQKSPTRPRTWKLLALVTWVWNQSEPVWNWSLWQWKGWKG